MEGRQFSVGWEDQPMSGRESCAMDERVSFIADQRTGLWTMTELCERYEVSRKTGYKWLHRYRLEGAAGLVERSRAARVHGRATPQNIVDAIVGMRRERPARFSSERGWFAVVGCGHVGPRAWVNSQCRSMPIMCGALITRAGYDWATVRAPNPSR